MRFLVLFFLLIASTACAEIEGYGNMRWGCAPPDNLELLDSRGRYKIYRGDDPLIKNIYYTFCKNQLCEAFGEVPNAAAFNTLLDLFVADYDSANFVDDGLWIWYRETDVLLFYDKTEDKGYFLYHHNPIFVELIHERMEKQKLEKKILADAVEREKRTKKNKSKLKKER
jgi:hypothetical protein